MERPTKKAKSQDSDTEELLRRGLEALDLHVRHQCAAIAESPGSEDLAEALGKVLRQILSIQGEQRKARAEERRARQGTTRLEATEWIRGVDAAERQSFIREAQLIDSGSVLA